MSVINTTKTRTPIITIEGHTNFDGGLSFDLKCPINKLRMMAASCLFGEPSYYVDGGMKFSASKINYRLSDQRLNYLVDVLKGVVTTAGSVGKTTAQVMESVIDDALDYNVEATLQVAVALRNEDLIRTTPQVILVRAANHKSSKGTGLIRKYAQSVIKRPDEPAVQMAYQINMYGKTIPNSLKKSWRDALQSYSEFQLSKYRMESRLVKTIDVVRVSHAHSDAISKLVYDKLKLNLNTWESVISEKGSTKETWEYVIDSLWVVLD